MASLSSGAAVAQPCARSVDNLRLGHGISNAVLRVHMPAHPRTHIQHAKNDVKIPSAARNFICAAEAQASTSETVATDAPLAYDGVIFDMVSKEIHV